MFKVCKTCKETKDTSLFYKRASNLDGFTTNCKVCENKRTSQWGKKNPERKSLKAKEWVKNNPEKIKEINKTWADNNPDKVNERWLKQCYGINLLQYGAMLEKQNGVCAICSVKPQLKEKLFVDHCHTTGEIRGLLCRFCNTALGFFKDDTNNLSNAIKYLKK